MTHDRNNILSTIVRALSVEALLKTQSWRSLAEISLRLLFSRHSSPSSISSSFFIIFMTLCWSLSRWGAQKRTQLSRCGFTSAEQRAAIVCLTWARMPAASSRSTRSPPGSIGPFLQSWFTVDSRPEWPRGTEQEQLHRGCNCSAPLQLHEAYGYLALGPAAFGLAVYCPPESCKKKRSRIGLPQGHASIIPATKKKKKSSLSMLTSIAVLLYLYRILIDETTNWSSIH